ncbi:MAC/perforin domain-containing protein [Pedobacter sp. UYP1]|jgi:hypothetical protein|uniref:MAC/perforin domain-containing protein n=1 Tax=Pedobacter sp. UYP1 TaxID=1756396 RepID=UPI003390A221
MKKLLLLLIPVTMFWSCKRQDDISPATKGEKTQTFSAGDGSFDRLGYGLDVTRDVLNLKATSDAPIFDAKKFVADNPARIDISTSTEGREQYYGGASAVDYIKDVSTKKSFDINGTNTPKIEGATQDGSQNLFTGSLSLNSSDQNRTTYSSKYSYASYEITQRVKRIRLTGDATISQLMQYLTPDFISNVANMSADQLVTRYGTHVLLDISLGGNLKFNYSGSIVTQSDYTKKTSDVKAGLGFGLLKIIGVNINASKTKEEITQITNTTNEREYTGVFFGGTNGGQSLTIDKDANTSQTVNIASWQQSINANNATLIDVDKAVFLYNFIADPVKKAQVKAAIEKHINDRQIKLSPQEVYEFSTPQMDSKHANNLDPNMHLKYLQFGWHPNGQPFKAYSFAYNGAVPVYQFINRSTNNRFLTTQRDLQYPAFVNESILFYAYTTQVPGSVPVYQFGSKTNRTGDFYYSTIQTPYDSSWEGGNWVVFYAFPN